MTSAATTSSSTARCDADARSGPASAAADSGDASPSAAFGERDENPERPLLRHAEQQHARDALDVRERVLALEAPLRARRRSVVGRAAPNWPQLAPEIGTFLGLECPIDAQKQNQF